MHMLFTIFPPHSRLPQFSSRFFSWYLIVAIVAGVIVVVVVVVAIVVLVSVGMNENTTYFWIEHRALGWYSQIALYFYECVYDDSFSSTC